MKSNPNIQKNKGLIRLVTAVLAVLMFSGCSQQNTMKVDVLETDFRTDPLLGQMLSGETFSGEPAVEVKQEPLLTALVLEAMSGQKSVYDKAYDNAKSYFSPENPVSGAVLGGNLKAKEEIAGFFRRLEKNQKYQVIVMIVPVNSSHRAVVGNFGYRTPYGKIFPPAGLLEKVADTTLIRTDEAVTKREAWPSVIAPFIARSFPDATLLPLFVNEEANGSDTEMLAAWLNENLPEDSLVIAHAQPKISADPPVAEFQLKFTRNVLENSDNSKIAELPLNNGTAVEVLQKYLFKRKAQRMQTQFMDHRTGNFLTFAMEGPLYRSRSAFIVAFGDIMLDRLVRTHMNNNGLDYPFVKMDETYLRNNDILLANLEGPVAKKKVATSKEIAFRFNPDVVPVLQKYSFDALSEANNHALDMGWAGFNDTFELFAPTGIKVFGNPREIEAKSVATFELQDRKIAFLGLEEVVFDIDDEKAVEKIKALTAEGYKVIVFPHWGVEYQHKPNKRQQELAHTFIDAGAVAVIGAHPHVVQSYETYNNRPVFYSLGNAIFDQYFSGDTQEGLSVAFIVSNDQLELFFLPIRLDRSQFRLMNQEERKAFLEKFAAWGEYQSEEERQNILKGKLTLQL